MCNIILDFEQQKVERCFVEGKVVDTSWNDCYHYYKKVYPNLIEGLEHANKKEGE